MKRLSDSDLTLLENLLDLSQDELRNAMTKYLRKNYRKVAASKDYVIAWGEAPVALVAHLDTVFDYRKHNELYYDARKGVMWKPDGAGFDDRAGVFAIIKIIQAGYRPTIIFTTDEEIGGLGAYEIVQTFRKPLVDVKYMIELDRQGSDDCVFYSCGNQAFIHYVESFGFNEEWGTFSDISILGPDWDIAAVNLSIGYYDEHTVQEVLHVAPMLSTIDKVKKMIEDANNAKFFNHKTRKLNLQDFYFKKYGITTDTMDVICNGCGTVMSDYNSIPVLKEDGCMVYYCGDCFAELGDSVDFCTVCGEAFEVTGKGFMTCRKCRQKFGQKR